MITLLGDCKKADLAVMIALCLSVRDNKTYGIITDRQAEYEGVSSISGVGIQEYGRKDAVLYDMYTSRFDLDSPVYFVTDGSVSSTRKFHYHGIVPDGYKTIYLDTGSKEGLLSLTASIGGPPEYVVPMHPFRSLEMCHLGVIPGSTIDSETESFLKSFLSKEFEMDKTDIASAIKVVKKGKNRSEETGSGFFRRMAR